MKFHAPLTEGVLVERYKRFFADVKLANGEVVTAHCANSGSMMNVKEPGSRVWITPSPNPKAKLLWRWEMIEVDGSKVGINTMHPNKIVDEAIAQGRVPELKGYKTLRREVKYGRENSRIDILLADPIDSKMAGLCYVEVKNVTLKREGQAQFPDAVTTRGAKHLRELAQMVKEGHRSVMVYLVQREDCEVFSIAGDIDPDYAKELASALKAGVEVLCYRCKLSETDIFLDRPVRLSL